MKAYLNVSGKVIPADAGWIIIDDPNPPRTTDWHSLTAGVVFTMTIEGARALALNWFLMTPGEADAIRRYLLGFSGEYDLHAE